MTADLAWNPFTLARIIGGGFDPDDTIVVDHSQDGRGELTFEVKEKVLS